MVEQLENDHRQRETILRFFLLTGHLPNTLKLRRQIIRRELPCRETLSLALNAKAIAVQQRDIKAVAIEPQVDWLHVDNPVLSRMQRRDQGSKVTSQAHFRTDAFRQMVRLRLPRL